MAERTRKQRQTEHPIAGSAAAPRAATGAFEARQFAGPVAAPEPATETATGSIAPAPHRFGRLPPSAPDPVLDSQEPDTVPTRAPAPLQRASELVGATSISSEQQEAVEEILTPTRSGGKKDKLITKDFEKNMKVGLEPWMTKSVARAKRQLLSTSPKLEMVNLKAAAAQAQALVSGVYGSYAGAASFSLADAQHRQDYKLDENITPVSQAPKESKVKYLMKYLMTISYTGGRAVMKAHNVDLKRKPDQKLFETTRAKLYAEYKDDLEALLKAWPGIEDPKTLTVQIQLNLEPKKGKTSDHVMRRGYWSAFQTLVHEYFHVLAHPLFKKTAKAIGGTGRNILIEGFCDHFAEPMWNDRIAPTLAGGDTLRETIEGDSYPYDESVVPTWTSYPEKAPGDKIATEVGEANAKAAYFLGHTEYIGQGLWSGLHEGADGMYFVPEGKKKSIAAVATETNVAASKIAADSFVLASATISGFYGLVAEGVRYHTVIKDDSAAKIAGQWGIDEPTLSTANPGVDWTALVPGARILIPAP